MLGRIAREQSVAKMTVRRGTWSIAPYAGAAFVELAGLDVSVYGLGGAGIPALELGMTSIDGAIHDETEIGARRLALRCLPISRSASVVQQFVDLLKPDRPGVTDPTTPAILRYVGSVRTLELPVVLDSWPREDGAALVLQLLATEPYWRGTVDRSAALGLRTVIAGANRVLHRSALGAWSALAAGLGGTVYALLWGGDGNLYAGGAFSGGVARWSGSAWVALSTGINGTVRALVWTDDGRLIAGGSFTTAGGVACANIASWSGSAWSALGAGTNGTVHALATVDDSIYVGGSFTSPSNNFANWFGGWHPVGTGLNGPCFALAIDSFDVVYAGGSFSTAGGLAAANVANWDIGSGSWAGMGAGLAAVGALCVDAADVVYAGQTGSPGDVWRWNGRTWVALGIGIGQVNELISPAAGELIAGGFFLTAGGTTPPSPVVRWDGAGWHAYEAALVNGASPIVWALARKSTGELVVGHDTAGSAAVLHETVVTNNGTAAVQPTITLTGPGTLRALRHKELGAMITTAITLQAGETLTVELSPTGFALTSSRIGDVTGLLAPGSAIHELRLLPGINTIGVLVSNTVGSAPSASWRDRYWSIESADA